MLVILKYAQIITGTLQNKHSQTAVVKYVWSPTESGKNLPWLKTEHIREVCLKQECCKEYVYHLQVKTKSF